MSSRKDHHRPMSNYSGPDNSCRPDYMELVAHRAFQGRLEISTLLSHARCVGTLNIRRKLSAFVNQDGSHQASLVCLTIKKSFVPVSFLNHRYLNSASPGTFHRHLMHKNVVGRSVLGLQRREYTLVESLFSLVTICTEGEHVDTSSGCIYTYRWCSRRCKCWTDTTARRAK